MNEHINPPCNSSLATSCTKSVMASSCGKGKVAALFTDGVSSSGEGELAIEETASTVSIAPNVCVVPEMSVAVREEEVCVQDFLDHPSGGESAARHFVLGGEADDKNNFVDIMGGSTAVGDVESGCRTFADALAPAELSRETLAKGVVNTSPWPTC